MKNDTTFVRMHSGDHLGDANMSKKDLLSAIELSETTDFVHNFV